MLNPDPDEPALIPKPDETDEIPAPVEIPAPDESPAPAPAPAPAPTPAPTLAPAPVPDENLAPDDTELLIPDNLPLEDTVDTVGTVIWPLFTPCGIPWLAKITATPSTAPTPEDPPDVNVVDLKFVVVVPDDPDIDEDPLDPIEEEDPLDPVKDEDPLKPLEPLDPLDPLNPADSVEPDEPTDDEDPPPIIVNPELIPLMDWLPPAFNLEEPPETKVVLTTGTSGTLSCPLLTPEGIP